jgi:hypothetical protein
MKRLALFAAMCMLAVSCGSSGGGGAKTTADQVGVAEPDIQLVQLVGPEELNWESGMIEMKYALRVNNHANEPITLRQIQIRTIGEEGPYWIPQSSYFFRESVAPGAERDIQFFAKAVSSGNKYAVSAQSPVSIRAVAYFEAPKGNFRKPFVANLGQSFKNNN